jgi:hypothetical protein
MVPIPLVYQQSNIPQRVQRKRAIPKFGRVFYTRTEVIPEGEPVMMGLFTVANEPAVILFDSGASHTFISRSFVVEHQLPLESVKDTLCVQSPGGRLVTKEMVY